MSIVWLLAASTSLAWAEGAAGNIDAVSAADAATAQPDDPEAVIDPPEPMSDKDLIIEELEERVNYLEEAMDEVEKRAILDRLQIGADYRLMLNSFRYDGPSPYLGEGGQDASITSAEIWSHRLRIPVQGNYEDKLRISARMLMFKHFGDNDEVALITDFQGARFPRDSGIRFEQAWLDWFITDWLALSMGRLSYTGVNPPGELRENSNVRSPTWGLQIVDGEYESLNVTFNLSKLLLPDMYLRAFYASWFPDFDDPDNDLFFIGTGQQNQRLVGWSVDLKIPKLGETFLQFGHFIMPRYVAVQTPIKDQAYDPNTNYANLAPPLDGSVLFAEYLPDSLGSYQNLNILIEAIDISGWGLDAFIGGTLGFLSPNDEAITYNIDDGSGNRVETPLLVMPSKGDTGIAYSFLTGFRYALPLSMDENPKIGFEYNYGSRYYVSFSLPHDQLLSKWVTRGNAYEGYVIMPIYPDHLFLRGGVLYIDNNWSGGLYGVNPDLPGVDSTANPQDTNILNFNMVLQATL
ncbi:MAG: hypothetical protein Tsb0020_03870 [Haliangiales bacterium]